MKTSVYVDGFNLYHGLFRHQRSTCTPRDKWLDLRSLAEKIIPTDATLHQVHYFTASLYRSKRDPGQNLRQDLYLRTVGSIPNVLIHRGKHIPVQRKGVPKSPSAKELGVAHDRILLVETFEEKGSDVNLAVQLLDDAWSKTVDCAIVVTNDSDFISAITSARKHIRVEIVSPQSTLSKGLRRVCDSWSILDPTLLPQCRLPNPRILPDGTEVFMPREWDVDNWRE